MFRGIACVSWDSVCFVKFLHSVSRHPVRTVLSVAALCCLEFCNGKNCTWWSVELFSSSLLYLLNPVLQ